MRGGISAPDGRPEVLQPQVRRKVQEEEQGKDSVPVHRFPVRSVREDGGDGRGQQGHEDEILFSCLREEVLEASSLGVGVVQDKFPECRRVCVI